MKKLKKGETLELDRKYIVNLSEATLFLDEIGTKYYVVTVKKK